MSRGDIRIVSGGYGTLQFDVDDRGTSGLNATLKPGEPMIIGGAGSNFVVLPLNGQPLVGTNTMAGVAHNESTETASVDGKIVVDLIGPGTILEAKATTTANIDTASELLGLMFDAITFDLTGSDFTFDEDENGARNTRPFTIVGGDIVRTRVLGATHVNVTLFGSMRGQTMD